MSRPLAPTTAGYNAAFLKKRQGMSMLVFESRDARADQAQFAIVEEGHLSKGLAVAMVGCPRLEGDGADRVGKPCFFTCPAQPQVANEAARPLRHPVERPDGKIGHWSVSSGSQPHMRAISDRFAVKLTLEYMSRLRWWLWLKPWMPWIRARRRHQVVVTLNGIDIKPENLLRLQDGDVVTDNKGRALIWSRGTLGPMQERIREFYRGVV